jgi:hypothetical protein
MEHSKKNWDGYVGVMSIHENENGIKYRKTVSGIDELSKRNKHHS